MSETFWRRTYKPPYIKFAKEELLPKDLFCYDCKMPFRAPQNANKITKCPHCVDSTNIKPPNNTK